MNSSLQICKVLELILDKEMPGHLFGVAGLLWTWPSQEADPFVDDSGRNDIQITNGSMSVSIFSLKR